MEAALHQPYPVQKQLPSQSFRDENRNVRTRGMVLEYPLRRNGSVIMYTFKRSLEMLTERSYIDLVFYPF